MTCIGSPCGACKFLRRKCVRGCVFAPYFCHEQGATHFAAIHKVFGASNVSKLLTHLPVQDRCEAAITIAYEAQARLQDPIYGCVAHIFALQQQVSSKALLIIKIPVQQNLGLFSHQCFCCCIAGYQPASTISCCEGTSSTEICQWFQFSTRWAMVLSEFINQCCRNNVSIRERPYDIH